MKACKNICIVSNCEQKPEFYVNFSRYHCICSTHLPIITSDDQDYKCSNCNNDIKCIKNLPKRNKAEYKESLKNPVDDNFQDYLNPAVNPAPEFNIEEQVYSSDSIQSSELSYSLNQGPQVYPYEKCAELNCWSNQITKVCDAHSFCQDHIQSSEYGYYCNKCPCNYCFTIGVTIKKCGIKACNSCLNQLTCCYICCYPSHTKKEKCHHYLCSNHEKPWLMCPCSPCEVCKRPEAKIRNCNHQLCEHCEIGSACRLCITGLCVSCHRTEPLYLFNCSVHYFCENCFRNKDQCDLCIPNCIRCSNRKSSEATYCKNHPLCDICLKEFDPGFCVYCNGPDDYTCNNCKYPNFFMTSNLNCNDKICRYCSNLPCNHQECPTCTQIRGFCIICKPKNFCKQCKLSDPANIISCGHNLCKNCGITAKDEHYVCLKCGNSQFLGNGECLACKTSFCDFCKQFEIIEIIRCGHKICKECKKNLTEVKGSFGNQRGLGNAKNLDNKCIFCQGIDLKFYCDFCFKYFVKVKSLTCGHKACDKCSTPKNICNLCTHCEVCLNLSATYPSRCGHKVCESCTTRNKSSKCIICTNFVIFCKSCAKYTEKKTCDKDHDICLECSIKYKEKTGFVCQYCNPLCFYCREEKPLLAPECSHLICQDCYDLFIKDFSSCILCDPNSENICENCSRVFLSKNIFVSKCDKRLCNQCIIKHSCETCKNKELKIKKDIGENDLKEILIIKKGIDDIGSSVRNEIEQGILDEIKRVQENMNLNSKEKIVIAIECKENEGRISYQIEIDDSHNQNKLENEKLRDIKQEEINLPQSEKYLPKSKCEECHSELLKNTPTLCSHNICQLCINKKACKECICFKCNVKRKLYKGSDGKNYCAICQDEKNCMQKI